jgi:hypothetical protein
MQDKAPASNAELNCLFTCRLLWGGFALVKGSVIPEHAVITLHPP